MGLRPETSTLAPGSMTSGGLSRCVFGIVDCCCGVSGIVDCCCCESGRERGWLLILGDL